jgi:hypothetical protein
MQADTPELALPMTAPDISVAEVDALCAHIAGRGWLTARQLESELGLDDRKVRAIAEHSDGRILSGPGCPGYKLFDGSASLADAIRATKKSCCIAPTACSTPLLSFPSSAAVASCPPPPSGPTPAKTR